MTNFSNVNVIFNSDTVSLQPLKLSHSEALVTLAEKDGLDSLWYTQIPNRDSINNYINVALSQKKQDLSLPFVVVENSSGKILGTTRICNADFSNRNFEIGHTWYGKDYQQTSVNTECKLMLLSYLFEKQHAISVVFRTHFHNHRSRAAILRLGAKQDGILRNHRIHATGEYRDTVIFSIIENEWPIVKKSLKYHLHR